MNQTVSNTSFLIPDRWKRSKLYWVRWSVILQGSSLSRSCSGWQHRLPQGISCCHVSRHLWPNDFRLYHIALINIFSCGNCLIAFRSVVIKDSRKQSTPFTKDQREQSVVRCEQRQPILNFIPIGSYNVLSCYFRYSVIIVMWSSKTLSSSILSHLGFLSYVFFMF